MALKIKEKVLSTFKGKNDKIFTPSEIVDMILARFPDTNRTSLLPADYCYNRINKDIEKRFRSDFHIFESLSNGTYKYLGEGYSYSGSILWKGKDVGAWSNGEIIKLADLK